MATLNLNDILVTNLSDSSTITLTPGFELKTKDGRGNYLELLRPDGTQSVFQTDGSTLLKAADGSVTFITLSDGTAAVLQEDGTYLAVQADGTTTSYRADGTAERRYDFPTASPYDEIIYNTDGSRRENFVDGSCKDYGKERNLLFYRLADGTEKTYDSKERVSHVHYTSGVEADYTYRSDGSFRAAYTNGQEEVYRANGHISARTTPEGESTLWNDSEQITFQATAGGDIKVYEYNQDGTWTVTINATTVEYYNSSGVLTRKTINLTAEGAENAEIMEIVYGSDGKVTTNYANGAVKEEFASGEISLRWTIPSSLTITEIVVSKSSSGSWDYPVSDETDPLRNLRITLTDGSVVKLYSDSSAELLASDGSTLLYSLDAAGTLSTYGPGGALISETALDSSLAIYNPDGSITAKSAAGTIISITLSDGTSATWDASLNCYQAAATDGSVAKFDANGVLFSVLSEDGLTIYSPDRSYVVTNADSSMEYYRADGTLRKTVSSDARTIEEYNASEIVTSRKHLHTDLVAVLSEDHFDSAGKMIHTHYLSGDTAYYQADGSTRRENSQATILSITLSDGITANRLANGTYLAVQADGTKTYYDINGAPISRVNQAGTITTVYESDGDAVTTDSTTQIKTTLKPDGTEIEENLTTGDKVTYETDGDIVTETTMGGVSVILTEKSSGVLITAFGDDTIVEESPDREIVTSFMDSQGNVTETIRRDAYGRVYQKIGSGVETQLSIQGTYTANLANGVALKWASGGSLTIEYPDARKEIIEAGGRKTLFVPSSPNSSVGETTIWHVDGAVDITHEDGSKLFTHSDGTTVSTAINGTVTVTDPNGSTIVKTSGGSPVVTLATRPSGDTAVYSAESGSIKKVEHEGGDPENEVLRTTYWRSDGRIEVVVGDTTTTWKTNGEVVEETKTTSTDTTTLEGTDRWDDATQTLITTYSNGMVRTTYLDGTYTMTYPDGSSMNIGKYGRTVMTAPDGSRATTLSASYEFLQEYTAADGVKYSIGYGRIKLTDQQGKVLFSRVERAYWWASGTEKELVLPDGTVEYSWGDLSRTRHRKAGNTWSIRADKSYNIGTDYWYSPNSGHNMCRNDSYSSEGRIQEAQLYDRTVGVSKVFHYHYTSGTGWEISLPGGSSLALDAVNNPAGSYALNSHDSMQFSMDEDNRLTVTYPDGYQCVYGSDLRMISETKGGSTTSYSYNENGNYSMTSAGHTMDYHADHTLSAVHLSGNDTLYFDSNECLVSEEKGGAKRLQVSYTAWGYISTAISSASIIEKAASSTLSVTEDSSLRQDNPDGTYTIWKADGEVEYSKKDEEGQAWITSGTLKPDGTIITQYVSTQRTTYKADGSTEQLTRDSKGVSTTTQPYTGHTAVQNPDGSSSETRLDGASVKTEKDGTTFTLQADGKTLVTEFTDGSVITRNADGTVEAQPTQGSQKLVQNESGDWVASMSGNVTLTWKADGSGNIITRQPEKLGSSKYNTIIQGIDNKITLVKSDGTQVIKQADANGAASYVQRNADGGYLRQNSDGRIVSRDKNGVVSVNNEEGQTYKLSSDGTQTVIDVDETTTTTSPDGIITQVIGDQKIETLPSGIRITRNAGKSLRVDAPDGSYLIRDENGAVTPHITANSQYILPFADGIWKLPVKLGGDKFIEIRDTVIAGEESVLEETYQLDDGSRVEIYSDGSIVQRRPGDDNYTLWIGGEGSNNFTSTTIVQGPDGLYREVSQKSNHPNRLLVYQSTGSVQELWISNSGVPDNFPPNILLATYNVSDNSNPSYGYTEYSNGVIQKGISLSAADRALIIPGGLTLRQSMRGVVGVTGQGQPTIYYISDGQNKAEGKKVLEGQLVFGESGGVTEKKWDKTIRPIWYYKDGSPISSVLAGLKKEGYKIVGINRQGEIKLLCRDKVEELEHLKWVDENGQITPKSDGWFYSKDGAQTGEKFGNERLTLYALTDAVPSGKYKLTFEKTKCFEGVDGKREELVVDKIPEYKHTGLIIDGVDLKCHWEFTVNGVTYKAEHKPTATPIFSDSAKPPSPPNLFEARMNTVASTDMAVLYNASMAVKAVLKGTASSAPQVGGSLSNLVAQMLVNGEKLLANGDPRITAGSPGLQPLSEAQKIKAKGILTEILSTIPLPPGRLQAFLNTLVQKKFSIIIVNDTKDINHDQTPIPDIHCKNRNTNKTPGWTDPECKITWVKYSAIVDWEIKDWTQQKESKRTYHGGSIEVWLKDYSVVRHEFAHAISQQIFELHTETAAQMFGGTAGATEGAIQDFDFMLNALYTNPNKKFINDAAKISKNEYFAECLAYFLSNSGWKMVNWNPDFSQPYNGNEFLKNYDPLMYEFIRKLLWESKL